MDKEVKMLEIERAMRNAFSAHDFQVLLHVEPLKEMLMENPREGISSINHIYNQALNAAYTNTEGENVRGAAEAMCGGPIETIPWAVYNVVGAVYPYFDRKFKTESLKQILNILDFLNSQDVSGVRGVGHTTGIQEPILLADIISVRPPYMPGFENTRRTIGSVDNLEELDIFDGSYNFDSKKIKDWYLLGYGLISPQHCSYAEQSLKFFEEKNPIFLQHILRATAALIYGREFPGGIKSREGWMTDLPESLHERIKDFGKSEEFPDYSQFVNQ